MEQEVSAVHQQPWGKTIGLFVGCIVILTGILKSVGPAEIVVRSVTSAIVTAVLIRTLIWTAVVAGAGEKME